MGNRGGIGKGLKITKISNFAGIVLPKEVLARLRVGPEDALYLTEAPDGVRLTATDPEFEEQMELAERVMRRTRKRAATHRSPKRIPCATPLPLTSKF